MRIQFVNPAREGAVRVEVQANSMDSFVEILASFEMGFFVIATIESDGIMRTHKLDTDLAAKMGIPLDANGRICVEPFEPH